PPRHEPPPHARQLARPVVERDEHVLRRRDVVAGEELVRNRPAGQQILEVLERDVERVATAHEPMMTRPTPPAMGRPRPRPQQPPSWTTKKTSSWWTVGSTNVVRVVVSRPMHVPGCWRVTVTCWPAGTESTTGPAVRVDPSSSVTSWSASTLSAAPAERTVAVQMRLDALDVHQSS